MGAPITLERFLFTPSHGLKEQSWAPREMQEARLNADGFGFGWFATDKRPATYVNPMPIWTDVNLRNLARSLSSCQWVANVRSATRRMPVNPFNTMPFSDNSWLFMHNGFIQDFAHTVRGSIRNALPAEVEVGIQGNTDAEYLFALLRAHRARDPDISPDRALLHMLENLHQWLGKTKALLNIIVADGQRVYALRHAVNGDCPSLYYAIDEPDFTAGQLVASETLTATDAWQAVPEHNLIVLDGTNTPRTVSI